MAITNAQQYQQLVNPPMKGKKRPGYRGDDAARSSEGTSGGRASPGAGAGFGDGPSRGISKGNTAREQGITNQYQGPGGTTLGFNRGPTEIIGGKEFAINPPTRFEEEQKNFAISIENDRRRREAKKRALRKNVLFKDLSLRDKLREGYINRTLDDNLVDFGAIDQQFGTIAGVPTGFVGPAIGALTVDPATKSFDIDSIRELASTKTTAGGSMSAKDTDTLGDIREDIQMRDRVLDPNDNVSFDDFQEYLNRNKIEDTTGGDGPSDPCKGPNPPAYCFVGIRSVEPEVKKEDDDDEIINYRLMSKGGRAAFRGGDAARSDAASGRNAGRADPSGGVDRPGGGDGPSGPPTNVGGGEGPKQVIEKFPSTIRAIDKMNLDKMLANMNLNTVTTDEDEDTNAIDTVFSEKPAADLQTVYGTGLTNRQQIEKNILNSMADGGRAGLAGGGMPYEGGIMDLESARQMYGLGKLVKKVTRGIKKIAKSPIGKAALAFGAYKLGGMDFGKGGSLFERFGNLSTLQKVGLGIGATSALSGLMTKEEEEESLYAGADIADPRYIMNNPQLFTNRRLAAEGGDIEKEPVAKKVMPLLDMDGKEKDYRETGGFVDMGRMEKADDVPARLSKNEFVFTADAVRNAGDGSVDKGAEVMYNMMKNLEAGGDVSEESQGLEGARKMFQTSQRLEEVL